MRAVRKKTSPSSVPQIAENSARGANQGDNWLESVLGSQLHLTRITSLSLNLAETRRTQRGDRVSEIRVIKDVEELKPKLQVLLLKSWDELSDAHIRSEER